MRCSATVVFPEPAPPRMMTGPLSARLMSSNCSGSMSATMSGRCLSRRNAFPVLNAPAAFSRRSGRAARRGAWLDTTFQAPPSRTKLPWGLVTRSSAPSRIDTDRRARTTPSTTRGPRSSSYSSPSAYR
jgi:hypothetical protein